MTDAPGPASRALRSRIATGSRLAGLVLIGLVAGCSPLLPLLGAALGGNDGNASRLSGPFAGAPSTAQNRRPTESPVGDGVANIDDQVKQVCRAQLPPPEPAPTSGCSARDVCLPGSERPLRMRVCAAAVASDAALIVPTPPNRDWHWSGEPTVSSGNL